MLQIERRTQKERMKKKSDRSITKKTRRKRVKNQTSGKILTVEIEHEQ